MKNMRDMSGEEIMDMPRYGLDDKLLLSCKACGKCCHNRHDLILTLYDVFNVAKYLGRETGYVISRYCELYIGDNSKLPIVRVKPVPPTNACPFLHGKRCGIHKLKPVVCSVYPLARVFLNPEIHRAEFLNPQECSENPPKREYVIRDWIGHASSEEAQIAGAAFSKMARMVTEGLRSDEAKALGVDDFSKIYSLMTRAMYIDYDTSGDFRSQFNHNMLIMCEELCNYFPICSWRCPTLD